MCEQEVLEGAERNRARRMRWWHDARFGMFVHWGLYSQLQRHEWVMNRERIPVKEYEKLAKTWKPEPWPALEWARLAKKAGTKYMVMTTKHHEGFCLWDTEQTDYNAVRRGPRRDLVREYVDACRKVGLRVGFYYSLMDWHHPDGARCAKDEKARRRFLDFTQGCVRELMTNYGKIDILWFDVPRPLPTPEAWESQKLIAMARQLQPQVIVNNRAILPADFGTPEERVAPEEAGRAWEACMTFNGSWGYQPTPLEDWRSVRQVLSMLVTAAAGCGNLLLNIGPKADGSVPPQAVERLTAVGKWLARNGEAVYGKVDRSIGRTEWMGTGRSMGTGGPCTSWTLKGKTAYFWCTCWPGTELALGGIKTKVKKASFLATGKPIKFRQTADRLVLRGLPKSSPDRIAGVTVIKLECASKLRQSLRW